MNLMNQIAFCAVGTVALAMMAPSAFAQGRTTLDFQVSLDGRAWSDEVAVTAGVTKVQVRALVTYTPGSPTSNRPIGLASINFQPSITAWNASSDSVLPFAAVGTNSNGGSVSDVAGARPAFGRIMPFAMTGPTSANPYVVHQQVVGGVSSMRLALRSATQWPGESGTENSAGVDGIACSQRAFLNVTPQDPLFAAQTSRVVVLKYAVNIAASAGMRVMEVGTPEAGLSRNWQTGEREASWYASVSDTYGQIKGKVLVDNATIRVIPGPAAFFMVLAAIGPCVRRRRAC
jgi:hypothetical protein